MKESSRSSEDDGFVGETILGFFPSLFSKVVANGSLYLIGIIFNRKYNSIANLDEKEENESSDQLDWDEDVMSVNSESFGGGARMLFFVAPPEGGGANSGPTELELTAFFSLLVYER